MLNPSSFIRSLARFLDRVPERTLEKMLERAPLNRQTFWALLSFSIFTMSANVSAEWIQVTGSAQIQDGLYDQARSEAQADALRKAAMQFGTEVHSKQVLRNGELVEDKVNFSAQAKVRRSQVQEEYVVDSALYMVMNVEMERVQTCPGSQAADYKKAVALLGFSLQAPSDAVVGGLRDIDRGLSQALSQSLLKQDSLIVYSASKNDLYADHLDAPTRYASEGQLTQTTQVAQDLGAQFVISGVIRDLGMEDPDHYKNSAWQSLLRVSKLSNPARRFSVDVFVHDGFSGSIIWQENFSTTADWNFARNAQVGFASPEFWNNSYGQAVKKELNTMAYLISEQLRCQPFMTRISRVDGRTLHFDSGARTGIRPGDKFSLYRTYAFYDANRVSGVELQNANTALTVSQVHPEFGSGTIGIEPGRINIQEDDLLIAW